MNKELLENNILQLSEDTLECLKLIERSCELFTFDTETSEDMEAFVKMMRTKALRIANPRDIKDINKNIKKDVLYERWSDNLSDNK